MEAPAGGHTPGGPERRPVLGAFGGGGSVAATHAALPEPGHARDPGPTSGLSNKSFPASNCSPGWSRDPRTPLGSTAFSCVSCSGSGLQAHSHSARRDVAQSTTKHTSCQVPV